MNENLPAGARASAAARFTETIKLQQTSIEEENHQRDAMMVGIPSQILL